MKLEIWVDGSLEIMYIFSLLPMLKILVAMATNTLNFKISDSDFYAFSLQLLYFLRYLLQTLNISFWLSTASYVTRFTTLAQNLSELPPLNLEFS
jgi:hypothetical protein